MHTRFDLLYRRCPLVSSGSTSLLLSLPGAASAASSPTAIKYVALQPSSADLALATFVVLAAMLILAGLAFVYLVRRLDRQWQALWRLLVLCLARYGKAVAPQDQVSPDKAVAVVPEQTVRAPSPAEAEAPPVPATDRPVVRVIMSRALVGAICDYVATFLQVHGAENEAGGILVGTFSRSTTDRTLTFTLQGFVDAGPQADFSAGSILFDNAYQAQRVQMLQWQHPNAITVGCFHRHPGGLDTCSGGDETTDREAVRGSAARALVFIILTVDNPASDPLGLRHDRFKLNFYVMAEETGFAYHPVRPELADVSLWEVAPALATLATARGQPAFFDLAVLRQIARQAEVSFHSIETPDGPGLLLSASLQDHDQRIQILWSPAESLRAFIQDPRGLLRELPGPWVQPEVGRHTWFSHLLLLIAANTVAPTRNRGWGRHHSGLLEDKPRLVAEVKAMREKLGDRVRLCQQGDVVFWEYIVHQCGRRFPIEIRYPRNYPAEPPMIISQQPLPPSPHQLADNELCWVDRFSGHSAWNPARDTAVVCIQAAHLWFACLLVYLTTGIWPTDRSA